MNWDLSMRELGERFNVVTFDVQRLRFGLLLYNAKNRKKTQLSIGNKQIRVLLNGSTLIVWLFY